MNYNVSSMGSIPAVTPQVTLKAPSALGASLPMAAPSQPVVQGDAFRASVQPTSAFPAAGAGVQFQAPGLSVQQTAAPMLNVQNQNLSPYTPTLTTLNISREDLQWATQLEAKVQQGYQPTADETAHYQALATHLENMRTNVQPMIADPGLPQVNYPAPQPQAPAAPGQGAQAPTGEVKQVAMSEIEWALILEEQVQKHGYKPTSDEEARYQNILGRFKANSEIKMGLLDALAAQSPWVGSNVAQIRYSKIMASQVSDIIGGIKNGTGTVMSGLKGLGMTALKSTGLSAVVSGGFSAVVNGIAYFRGEKTKLQAVSSIVTDSVTGAATGLGATVAGGIATAALAATSITGLPLTLLIGGAGILGGYLADKLLTKTGAKDWIRSKVIGWMTPSQPAQSQTVGQQPYGATGR
jgi:hypothetical protein